MSNLARYKRPDDEPEFSPSGNESYVLPKKIERINTYLGYVNRYHGEPLINDTSQRTVITCEVDDQKGHVFSIKKIEVNPLTQIEINKKRNALIEYNEVDINPDYLREVELPLNGFWAKVSYNDTPDRYQFFDLPFPNQAQSSDFSHRNYHGWMMRELADKDSQLYGRYKWLIGDRSQPIPQIPFGDYTRIVDSPLLMLRRCLSIIDENYNEGRGSATYALGQFFEWLLWSLGDPSHINEPIFMRFEYDEGEGDYIETEIEDDCIHSQLLQVFDLRYLLFFPSTWMYELTKECIELPSEFDGEYIEVPMDCSFNDIKGFFNERRVDSDHFIDVSNFFNGDNGGYLLEAGNYYRHLSQIMCDHELNPVDDQLEQYTVELIQAFTIQAYLYAPQLIFTEEEMPITVTKEVINQIDSLSAYKDYSDQYVYAQHQKSQCFRNPLIVLDYFDESLTIDLLSMDNVVSLFSSANPIDLLLQSANEAPQLGVSNNSIEALLQSANEAPQLGASNNSIEALLQSANEAPQLGASNNSIEALLQSANEAPQLGASNNSIEALLQSANEAPQLGASNNSIEALLQSANEGSLNILPESSSNLRLLGSGDE
jgi:hypothetical protein